MEELVTGRAMMLQVNDVIPLAMNGRLMECD